MTKKLSRLRLIAVPAYDRVLKIFHTHYNGKQTSASLGQPENGESRREHMVRRESRKRNSLASHILIPPQVLPGPRLAPYIQYYQLFYARDDAHAPLTARDFPSGGVDLALSFSDVPIHSQQFGQLPYASIVGPRRQADSITFSGQVDIINIHFRPGGSRAFFPCSVAELTGQVTRLDDLWHTWKVDAIQDLRHLSITERLVHLERWLLHQLDDRHNLQPHIKHAIHVLQHTNGRMRIAALADISNVSVSQLDRSFKESVGMTPKHFARQRRFAAFVERIRVTQGQNEDWGSLAYHCGYADQAHLIRECIEFGGLSPTQMVLLKVLRIFFKTS